MKRLALPKSVRRMLLSATFWWVLPTPATLYLNRERLREPLKSPSLPAAEWSRSERRALLDRSEDRLRNLEGKGPGLATVSAVIVAAVLVAIASGWSKSTAPGRVILAFAAAYSALSLVMPLYLVGPLKRDTMHLAELDRAVRADDPEETLAESAAEAAMTNDLHSLRLSNLLDAARRELSYALILLLLWAVLVPATGLLRHDSRKRSGLSHAHQAARERSRPHAGC